MQTSMSGVAPTSDWRLTPRGSALTSSSTTLEWPYLAACNTNHFTHSDARTRASKFTCIRAVIPDLSVLKLMLVLKKNLLYL